MCRKNTFIVSNTAHSAQLGFILNQHQENSILYHSKFKVSDKKYLFNELNECFKEHGTKKYNILRSGPIIQASLNITCNHMISEISSPQNILQRLGRLDRFGKSNAINTMQIFVSNAVIHNRKQDSSSRWLNKNYSLNTTYAWYKHMIENLNNKILTLSDIYQNYGNFFQMPEYQKYINDDLEELLTNSISLINQKIMDPIKIQKNYKDNNKKIIRKNSIRSDSLYVQMAVLNVENYINPIFEDYYAYELPQNENNDFNNITESLKIIDSKELLSYAEKYQSHIDAVHPVAQIPKKYNTNKRKLILKACARNPEYPIYVSFINKHIDDFNIQRNNQSIYYFICNKQPIGSISYEKFEELKSYYSKKNNDE